MFDLDSGLLMLLFSALFLACLFEFINGFHDTANAVATVIYTKSLKPLHAVAWSGSMNFLGVVTGGVGVGMSIVNLLPIDLLIDENIYHSIATVMAMLFTAIIWNLGTWFLGLPSSSSHTLIGSILGVGLGYAMLPNNVDGFESINWDKAESILFGLLLAPLLGFTLAIGLMFILRSSMNPARRKEIFSEPKKDATPPDWVRWTLIGTCTLVSFFHGKNDGQKGIGLMMLILIGVVPSYFAISNHETFVKIRPQIEQIEQIVSTTDTTGLGDVDKQEIALILDETAFLQKAYNEDDVFKSEKLKIRGAILNISSTVKKLVASENVHFSISEKAVLKKMATVEEKGIRKVIDHAPFWVIMLISLSLGFGTMVGWKRIVVTIGEKIGKTHLTYAQGASAELVAALTIGLASGLGLPVSTTHTLSSGIAGTMVASKGVKNLQVGTVRNIALAWILTLPVSITLSAGLFLLFRYWAE
ncbi:inorganic phosphate transporter [Marinilongibacter aquaticus]|uniref:inorganic phosphate transporter n=1 Tax=Marinilongibacter aquaticus TaxID=2975157 RepID=UPI0021BD2954|nr:inorganic phosphate transporter [Marinilongibacter aquaticus]UBM59075.1 inorganic phosphate transporter [Marinilongibacter aquaticus]